MKGSLYHQHVTKTFAWARPPRRDTYRRFAKNAYGMEPEEFASALHTRNMFCLRRDEHECRACGTGDRGLMVVPISKSPDQALETRNCLTLCHACARRSDA